DVVRADGNRRVGGDRGGGDQALRVHAVLPWAGAGGALHPDRSVLPDVEGAALRFFDTIHRAGGGGEHGHAVLGGGAGGGGAVGAGACGQGGEGAGAGGGVQEGRG